VHIVTVGGGPAGLYFGLLMKKADPSHRITVLERNPPDATFGWGVVFSEETLAALRDADRPTFDEIVDTFAKWSAIDVRYRGETVRSGGHVFSAISRKRLLNILQRRCADLGVDLRFDVEVEPEDVVRGSGPFAGADVIVAADGVNSRVRAARAEAFRPTLDVHRTKFVWFGTPLTFRAFTFIFRENEHGLFQVHAYPFDATTSTFIVECPEETWRRAGLDQAGEQDSIAYCEKLFAEDLRGRPLLSNKSIWISFVTVRNETWHDGHVALMGDAAHTAHFTIGSGTKLAMEDAVSLADAFGRRGDDVAAAVVDYEMERQPVIERFQQAATESAEYFESVRRYASFEPIQFAFNLLTRSGRISHLNLEMRDPRFVRTVDSWFAERAPMERLVAPPPLLAPLSIRAVSMANRVAMASPSGDDAPERIPGQAHRGRYARAAESGAGLVVSEMVAVSAEGRITPGTPGLWSDDHAAAWRSVVEVVKGEGQGRLAVRLGHAGRRGATRPRSQGVDLPLRSEAWPLVSASPIPYTARSAVPAELSREQMVKLLDQFREAAGRAARAGFDMLELDMSHGYLLASFLSPLTNTREDEFGGSPENGRRFPLRAFDAVREAWPMERPLAARLTATDWARGGAGVDDAVAMASELKERGCDLIDVVAGQTVPWDAPAYGRFYLVPFSDRIRNEAGIPTMVGGGLTTGDEVNTILAAGRADLCTLDPAIG
jgi:anthraniloyl-CoA monooxygenase